ncbi:NAD(P)/FAD-dependent oxidoreductase [Neisseria zoodegmatis]|uniref:D-amino acid dehydrogenase small subunit n=1 Tax=Neisseria zoodegmatis TaxID=326523 RepID=A0AB38DMJ5_9NEIS|nr:FAD-dependent oxidoreductase [Neisseria zoodegmatis]OSI09397.1 FAD-dependent oxidoreductase [Neisseria zoodegmatis]SNU78632.1 D-amino acid dehydrogenase small subunit [Neisseria zoodegmatis]
MSGQVFSAAVVGGGIVGLSIALALQSSGESVLLLERDNVCGGASYGNAGHIATEQVFPIASPDVLKQLPKMLFDPLGPLRLDWKYLPKITPWLFSLLRHLTPERFRRSHRALMALNSRALPAWQAFAREWGVEKHIRIEGSLLVCETESGQAALQKHGRALNELGVVNEWLDHAGLHEREPALADTQRGALFYPDTGHVVDLAGMAADLQQAFIRAGGTVSEHTDVSDIQSFSDGLFRIIGGGKAFEAKRVVIAAGAFSKPWLKKLCGSSVPLDTERGYHLMLSHSRDILNVPVSSFERKFIMTPMNAGLRLAGTVEFAGLDAPPNMERAEQLFRLAEPMLKGRLNRQGAVPWMGFRPSVADSLPVIDRKENVLLAFGHQHLGLTQAPLTAQLVKALYFGEQPAMDLSPYRFNRFGS